MRWTGKLIGGLLGLLLFGPIGAAIGVLLGHQLDEHARSVPRTLHARGSVDIGERFFQSVFQIMGHVAKCDGRVSEQEIVAARQVMAELRLGPAQVQDAIRHFTAGKQPGFDRDAVIVALRRSCAGRPDLLHVFVEIQMRAALAGSDLHAPGRAALQKIAAMLDVSGLELAHMEAVLRFRQSGMARERAQSSEENRLAEAYRVLEAEPDVTDEDLARAYRRQLSRHHPDKLKANGLPESMLEHAKQRTQQIIEAYDFVRERRGMR
jgi:DnaJ like chaperone protein